MDLLKNYGIKMKIGRFSGHFPNGQQLFMSDDIIEWATDINQVI
jgi:vomeronasal 2 receptor